ncbi:MAG: gliding motility lipoprotein GldH [Bacteroidales bacterium]|nr:gliding motility lipoprotein GldH [Bacteroidales bacterium]
MKNRINLLLVGLGLLFAACSNSSLIDDYHALPAEGWSKTDKQQFELNITDTTVSYRFFINIRNTVDYKYSNLYVFLNTRFPNGNHTRDTIECLLAEPSGKWVGHGMGRIRENQILLNQSLRFPIRGKYKFELEQAMRTDTLQGITDIGIRIQQGY